MTTAAKTLWFGCSLGQLLLNDLKGFVMRVLSFALPLVVAASAAFSGPISFDGNWNEQRLQLFNSNDYGFNGNRLSIESDGAVSLA